MSTPGPWTVEVHPSDGMRYIHGNGKCLARMQRHIMDPEEGAANEALVLAAPDYYAAAEAIRAYVVSADGSDVGDPCDIPPELLRALLDAHKKAYAP